MSRSNRLVTSLDLTFALMLIYANELLHWFVRNPPDKWTTLQNESNQIKIWILIFSYLFLICIRQWNQRTTTSSSSTIRQGGTTTTTATTTTTTNWSSLLKWIYSWIQLQFIAIATINNWKIIKLSLLMINCENDDDIRRAAVHQERGATVHGIVNWIIMNWIELKMTSSRIPIN